VVKDHVVQSRVGESVGAVQAQHVDEARRWQVEQVLLALAQILGVLTLVPGHKQTLVHSVVDLDMPPLQKRRQAMLSARVIVCMLKVRLCILGSLLSSGMRSTRSSSCSQVTLSPELEARGGG
jgi:hypothetical protein